MADDPMTLDAPPAEPAPASEPPAPPPPPEDPDEALAIDLPAQGGKHVPLTALKSVREENKALKEKAAQADQYAQWIAQHKPYVDFLQQNPQLLQPQRPAPQPAPPDADPRLVDLAKSLDFYTADLKPDLDRARKHQQIVRQEATEIAQQIVAPLAMNTYQDQANRNWQQAVQEKLPSGQAIDANLLAVAWREVARQNPAMVADPRVVRIIVNNVVAEQMRASPLSYHQPTAPGRPPVMTENVGPAPAAANRMNDTQRAIVAGRNIDDKKFAALTRGFQPGRMNVLEDE